MDGAHILKSISQPSMFIKLQEDKTVIGILYLTSQVIKCRLTQKSRLEWLKKTSFVWLIVWGRQLVGHEEKLAEKNVLD